MLKTIWFPALVACSLFATPSLLRAQEMGGGDEKKDEPKKEEPKPEEPKKEEPKK